jgi:CHAT domain-containing protein/tetratricopeptide (TPR) repeat protein
MACKTARIPNVSSSSRWPVGHAFARLIVTLFCVSALTLASGGLSLQAQLNQEVRSLEPGKPIERGLSGGQSHSYQITITSSQYLHLVVDQRGIDVEVALFVPEGKKLIEVDNEHQIEGSETVSVVTEAIGTYRIEVCSSERTGRIGRYEIKVEELRKATAEDKHRVAAESVFREAEQLQDGTSEAKRTSIEKYQEALTLYRKAGDRSREAQSLQKIGMAYEALGEMQLSLEKFKETLLIFRALGNGIGEVTTLNYIGDVYTSQGEPQNALEVLNEALPIARVSGDRKGEAETLNQIGEAYFSLGEPQKALDKFYEALPVRKAAGDRRGEAATLNSIGKIYRSLGEPKKALEKYNESLPLRRAEGNRRGEAFTLHHISTVYKSLGEMQKALEKSNEALLILRAVGDRMTEARVLNHSADVYSSLGEPQKALERLNEARPILRALGDRIGEAETLHVMGEVYSALGEPQKALDRFNEALPIRRAVADRRGEASTLNGIAIAYQSLGEAQKALDKYNEALAIRRALSDRRGEAATLNSIGILHQLSGEFRKALDKYNEALLLRRAVSDRMGEAGTLHHIGEAYFSLRELQKARDKYEEALPIRRSLGDRRGEAATLLGIARVEQRHGDPLQARKTIEQAIGIIESVRANIVSHDLRASYFASGQEYYECYIDVLMKLHRQRPSAAFDVAALEVSERARARSLLEQLTEARADIRQGVESSLLEHERALQQRLNEKASAQISLLHRKHTPEEAEVAAREIAHVTTEYEELQARIRASSPQYAALTQPQPLNVAEIQRQVLDDDTMLLEYALGRERSYLWAVTPVSFAVYELPERAQIEAAVRHVYASFSSGSIVNPGALPTDKQGAEAARALSRMLLGPVAGQLGTRRLLIVASGALQYLPFGALPVPESGRPEERNMSTTKASLARFRSSASHLLSDRPLITDHEIVNLPSASTLAVLRREQSGRPLAAKQIAVLADPVFDPKDPRVKAETGGPAKKDDVNLQLERAVREAGLTGFDRLRSTRREADEIIAFTHEGESLKALDFDASRAMATSERFAQYRIVHLATHGLLNSQYPELSGLVLSLVDEKGQPQNGFLRAHEVYNLKLGAELVVLSGCQTALGKEVQGEGLLSLTRGFMYAGAPRVVASLWRVPDKATAELMKRFYRGVLVEGLTPAAALRTAQVALWKESRLSAPYYWAAFVLQGEWK